MFDKLKKAIETLTVRTKNLKFVKYYVDSAVQIGNYLGEPLYRKVFVIPLTAVLTVDIDITDLGVDKAIDIKPIFQLVSNPIHTGQEGSDITAFIDETTVPKDTLTVTSATGNFNITHNYIHVIVEFTKA